MTHSITLPKSYMSLKSKELRHRAGLAWAAGLTQLAQAIENMAVKKLAIEKQDRIMPGPTAIYGRSRRTKINEYKLWLTRHGIIRSWRAL